MTSDKIREIMAVSAAKTVANLTKVRCSITDDAKGTSMTLAKRFADLLTQLSLLAIHEESYFQHSKREIIFHEMQNPGHVRWTETSIRLSPNARDSQTLDIERLVLDVDQFAIEAVLAKDYNELLMMIKRGQKINAGLGEWKKKLTAIEEAISK